MRDLVSFDRPGLGVLQLVGPSTAATDRPEILPLATTEWPSEDAERAYRESLSPETSLAEYPNFALAAQPALEGGTAAFSRAMIMDDARWYASEFYNKYVVPSGMGDFAMAMRISEALRTMVMLGGHPAHGDPGASPRVVKMLGILAEEIVPLIGTRLCLDHHANIANLTPRQRQTLELLLDGLSEKQVAGELGISRATVHDYTVQLHRHFDVSSRGELLSYFVHRMPKDNNTERGVAGMSP